LIAVVTLAPERECQNRNVINADRLKQRKLNARRLLIHVFENRRPELDQALFHVFTDKVPDGENGEILFGHRVDVFHAGNLADHLFQRLRNPFFHFSGRASRAREENVHQRNEDLRLFLSRRIERAEQPNEQRGNQQQGRKLGIDKCPGYPTGNPRFQCATSTL